MASDEKPRSRKGSTHKVREWRPPLTANTTVVPEKAPAGFPQTLWPRTCVILLEAREQFPFQTQTLEFCKHVTAKMTPVFREAVNAGTLPADAVLRENGGGMKDLLCALLLANDPDPSDNIGSLSDGLSDKASRLDEQVTGSEEWLVLARAVTTATQKSPKSFQAQTSKTAPRDDAGRKRHSAMVEDYIQEVLEKTGRRLTKKDIWSRAGYKSRTEFERWEREDPNRSNSAAAERFTRLLTIEKPHLK